MSSLLMLKRRLYGFLHVFRFTLACRHDAEMPLFAAATPDLPPPPPPNIDADLFEMPRRAPPMSPCIFEETFSDYWHLLFSSACHAELYFQPESFSAFQCRCRLFSFADYWLSPYFRLASMAQRHYFRALIATPLHITPDVVIMTLFISIYFQIHDAVISPLPPQCFIFFSLLRWSIFDAAEEMPLCFSAAGGRQAGFQLRSAKAALCCQLAPPALEQHGYEQGSWLSCCCATAGGAMARQKFSRRFYCYGGYELLLLFAIAFRRHAMSCASASCHAAFRFWRGCRSCCASAGITLPLRYLRHCRHMEVAFGAFTGCRSFAAA